MKTVEEIKKERDAELQGMEERYRDRQNEVAKEKEAVKAEAEKKLEKGENIDSEKDRHKDLQRLEDKNFDDYKDDRKQVSDYHQQEIDRAEKENDDYEK